MVARDEIRGIVEIYDQCPSAVPERVGMTVYQTLFSLPSD